MIKQQQYDTKQIKNNRSETKLNNNLACKIYSNVAHINASLKFSCHCCIEVTQILKFSERITHEATPHFHDWH